jgi:uroporphyrinogen decarboxylase
MNEWVEFVRDSQQRFAMPIMTHPGIELIGKKIKDAVTDGEIQFQAVKAIHDTYPTAAATMMMDLTVEAEAFGAAVNFADDEIPTVAGRLASDRNSIEELKIPSLDRARVPQYLKAAKLAAASIPDRPVFAGCIGPFSLAARLFGLSDIMTALYLEPDGIKSLLDKCSAFLLEYACKFKSLGLDGIIMAEPAAGLLSPKMCDEFSSHYIKPIVDGVQDDQFLFILHNCGNKGHVTQSMISTGAGGLHFGNAINLVKTLRELPAEVLAMGNLDPAGIFKLAGPDMVFSATTELLRNTSGCKNFVISSGCDLPPKIPAQNVASFFEAVDVFNRNERTGMAAVTYAR